MKTVFSLSNARSGTNYISYLLGADSDCYSVHEPYNNPENPPLFGRSIYEYTTGNSEYVENQFLLKEKYIKSQKCDLYVETSHAFLKSFYKIAYLKFPDMKLIRLYRSPLLTAKSESHRQAYVEKINAPDMHYKIGKREQKYFYWGLTGKEPIYSNFNLSSLTLFQFHLIQAIEIDNRAREFIDDCQLDDSLFRIDAECSLGDASTMQELLRFLGLRSKTFDESSLKPRNRTPATGVTVIIPMI